MAIKVGSVENKMRNGRWRRRFEGTMCEREKVDVCDIHWGRGRGQFQRDHGFCLGIKAAHLLLY